MTRSLWSRLAALVLISAGVVAMSSSTANAATGPMYGAPAVGTCYNLGASAAWNDQSMPAGSRVPCSAKHTLQVFAVPQIPSNIALKGLAYERFIEAHCGPQLVKVLGGNGNKTVRSDYWYWVFVPTATQQSKGAHWTTCAVGQQLGPDTLAVTVGRVKPLPATLPARMRVCLTQKDTLTNCAAPHKFHIGKTTTVTATAVTVVGKADRACTAPQPGGGALYYYYRYLKVADPNTWVIACFDPAAAYVGP